ncbi:MAG: hypothetical protein NHB14_27180 [Desulfosporosinus sp.]|nr:hypothetical protein [Desulfosporosinus sp.]
MTINRAISGCSRSLNEPMRAEEVFAKEDFESYCMGSNVTTGDKPDSVLRYLNENFQSDRERHSTYKDRKTGFPNLDRELNGLYPGLYVIGGISSVGKTTFTHQLADQLAGMETI